MSDEQQDVWIGAPSADAGGDPVGDDEPEQEDEEEK